ncbi:hypothetical protein FRB95_006537 [Tulasnella sp. JGI-2019a]|nr:hypothetical protein FRB95_006537 [Tulasnella sp. JGI-2019a]
MRGEPLRRKPAVYKLLIFDVGQASISFILPAHYTFKTSSHILFSLTPMDAFQILSTVTSSFSTTKAAEVEEIFRDAEDGSGQSGYCVIA